MTKEIYEMTKKSEEWKKEIIKYIPKATGTIYSVYANQNKLEYFFKEIPQWEILCLTWNELSAKYWSNVLKINYEEKSPRYLPKVLQEKDKKFNFERLNHRIIDDFNLLPKKQFVAMWKKLKEIEGENNG
jgi:hypothetical protein